MPRYIAFLRGINVGGHRVKMDRLRGLFHEMGFEGVSTFIASGNVLVETDSDDVDSLRKVIEGGLRSALGYPVETFLRTPERLAEIGDHGSPPEYAQAGAGDAGGTAHYVLFLHHSAPAPLRAALSELESAADRFSFDGKEIHWWIRGKMSESPLFGGVLERALRDVPNTMRNVNTLRRLVAKIRSG
jgi:uncharacterized protein (DUF1697 family)